MKIGSQVEWTLGNEKMIGKIYGETRIMWKVYCGKKKYNVKKESNIKPKRGRLPKICQSDNPPKQIDVGDIKTTDDAKEKPAPRKEKISSLPEKREGLKQDPVLKPAGYSKYVIAKGIEKDKEKVAVKAAKAVKAVEMEKFVNEHPSVMKQEAKISELQEMLELVRIAKAKDYDLVLKEEEDARKVKKEAFELRAEEGMFGVKEKPLSFSAPQLPSQRLAKRREVIQKKMDQARERLGEEYENMSFSEIDGSEFVVGGESKMLMWDSDEKFWIVTDPDTSTVIGYINKDGDLEPLPGGGDDGWGDIVRAKEAAII